MSAQPIPTQAPIAPPKPPKRRRSEIIGPLFFWELIRLARRGQDARARFILASSLLIVLTLFTFAWFPSKGLFNLFLDTGQSLSLQDSAKFAERFTLTFVLCQLAVLALLTPAYAAGGISEEKEKKTFEFLLVSDLTSREIVLGKFLGRLVFLLGITLAGLPILALTQLYGGVSINFLLVSYLITITTVTMLAAVSAAAACAVDTFRGALFRSYGLAALHIFAGCGIHPFLSPFGIVSFLFFTEGDSIGMFWTVGLAYAAAQLFVGLFAIVLAIRWVRKMRSKSSQRSRGERHRDRDSRTVRQESPETLEEDEEVVPKSPIYLASRPKKHKPRRRPHAVAHVPEDVLTRPKVYGNDPFLWKELYTLGSKRTADDDSIRGVMIAVGVVVGLTVAFMAAISMLAVIFSSGSAGGRDVAQRLLIIGGTGGLLTYLLYLGSAAAGSVVKERQRLTLESLLTIPVERRAILWPKWRVSATRGWWWGIPVSATIPLGFLFSNQPASSVPVALLLGGAALFTVSFGLWLSIRCHTVTRGVLWLMPAVGFLSLFPVIAWWLTLDYRIDHLLMPIMLIVAALVGIGAWAFWRFSCRAFDREGR